MMPHCNSGWELMSITSRTSFIARTSFIVPWLLVAAVGLAGCSDSQNRAASQPPPPTVTVANPVKRTVIDQDEYVGRFVAVDSVEIRAHVSGYLDKVNFEDGQTVKQGDPLFTIDKRPFQAALDQATANLAQAKANLAFADADLARGQALVKEKTITEQTFDQRTQAKRVAEASVQAQQAAVQQAALDLQFTDLKAPVSGRIGDRRVSPGNLVTGGTGGTTTLLATIVSTDPIRFEFTFDEAAYLRYERLSKQGQDVTSRDGSVYVLLRLIDEPDFVHPGRLDFVDNVIDRAAGTIRGRAEFSNEQGLFTPGMFARIRVPGSPAYPALLLPDVAIGSEQARKYVFALDKDNVARLKYVELGDLYEGLRVIKGGIAPDDRIVVNGVARVRPNQKVTPEEDKGASPPGQAKADATNG